MQRFIRRFVWCPAGHGPASWFQLNVLYRLIEFRWFRRLLLNIMPNSED